MLKTLAAPFDHIQIGRDSQGDYYLQREGSGTTARAPVKPGGFFVSGERVDPGRTLDGFISALRTAVAESPLDALIRAAREAVESGEVDALSDALVAYDCAEADGTCGCSDCGADGAPTCEDAEDARGIRVHNLTVKVDDDDDLSIRGDVHMSDGRFFLPAHKVDELCEALKLQAAKCSRS